MIKINKDTMGEAYVEMGPINSTLSEEFMRFEMETLGDEPNE